jgi:hypothetical protein
MRDKATLWVRIRLALSLDVALIATKCALSAALEAEWWWRWTKVGLSDLGHLGWKIVVEIIVTERSTTAALLDLGMFTLIQLECHLELLLELLDRLTLQFGQHLFKRRRDLGETYLSLTMKVQLTQLVRSLSGMTLLGATKEDQ